MPGLKALVPLDGSTLAESAFDLLPFIKTLGFDTVRLVCVWESHWDEREVKESGREGHVNEAAAKGRNYLGAYLDQQAERVKGMGFAVETSVRIGKAAEQTLEDATAGNADLILIATHGRDGLARVRLGSVADVIIRHASCPTLVIGPNVDVHMAPYSVRRILVPLDGSALAEEALPIAVWVAKADKAEIDLVRVISLTAVTSTDPMMDVYPVDLLTAMEEGAKTYLNRIGGQIAAKVPVQTAMLEGNAGDQLLEYLKERPAGLVVVASRGRSGILRATLGSVADRMLHGPAPVLVLRPDEEIRSRLVTEALNATA